MKAAGRRAVRNTAMLGAVVAAVAGLTATPAQAQTGYWQSCMQEVGSYHYLGWDLPDVTLGKGSGGVCVKELQSDLVQLGLVASQDVATFVDGDFGGKTYDAVVAYQRKFSDAGGVDGLVGRNTWHGLIARTEFE
ncbi:peptidoglycan-binding domain-containing protein [Kitasatospora sp. NPDC089797]|uniref:peptidoglycan-binding domain-containing protein n=1 Tax=Kitasatospora sp. NPDC089797 TaxID=3155298 RepID=UPI00343F6701